MKNPLSFYRETKKFLDVDLWAEEKEASPVKHFFRKALRAAILTAREFTDGQWPLKASALTFVSLISLVPLLAFILSISKGLGAEKILYAEINNYIFGLPGGEVTQSFVSFKNKLIAQINTLNFDDPNAKQETLDTIESLEISIPPEEKRQKLPSQPEESEDIPTFGEPDLPQVVPASREEIQAAVEEFKSELSEIVKSINFEEEDAKQKLKEQIGQITLSIPTNISLNILHYKNQVIHFVEKTSFGYLGAIGLFSLVFIVVRAFGTIETSFNDIWKIKKSRSIFRKFSNYISMLVIIPLLLLASTTVTAALTNEGLVKFLNRFGIGEVYLIILKWFLPILVLWIAFITAYIFIPNTKVRFLPAAIGGVVGGTIFHLVQIFYFKGQSGLANYNVIYGAFAAIPLFLLWLQTSWTIILFGAELSFVIQNVRGVKLEMRTGGIDYASREFLGLLIMGRIVSQFLEGKGEKWSDERLSEELNVPVGIVQEIILALSDASLIIEIPVMQYTCYMPGRDLDSIYVGDIIGVMRGYGEDFVPVRMTQYDKKIAELMEKVQDDIKNSLQFTIKDVIAGTEPAPPSSSSS
ncbi:MAG: YihY/virulence factor BrkB family protein [wastewater metagenome]|nr:YihY/virulence factor BrkB family protein [Candidatus Loosdrechtia aerotolerans]